MSHLSRYSMYICVVCTLVSFGQITKLQTLQGVSAIYTSKQAVCVKYPYTLTIKVMDSC